MAFKLFSKENNGFLDSLTELKYSEFEGLSWSAKCGAKRVLKKMRSLNALIVDLEIVGSKGRADADPKKVKKSKKVRAAKEPKGFDAENEMWTKFGINKKCAKCAKACKQNGAVTLVSCGDFKNLKKLR